MYQPRPLMPPSQPLTTKEATDKIVAYLSKLNDLELSRITSEIKQLRERRARKLQGTLHLDLPNGKETDTATNQA